MPYSDVQLHSGSWFIATASGDTLYALYHSAKVSAALGVPAIPGLNFRQWSNLAVPGMSHDAIDKVFQHLWWGKSAPSDLRAVCLPADNAGRLAGLTGGNSTCLFLRAEPPACQDSLLFTCAHTRRGHDDLLRTQRLIRAHHCRSLTPPDLHQQ